MSGYPSGLSSDTLGAENGTWHPHGFRDDCFVHLSFGNGKLEAVDFGWGPVMENQWSGDSSIDVLSCLFTSTDLHGHC